ncbi:MAG: GNAT family N-acetyltransferase [Candidatus Acinetobacter avistercoris]|uniref:GNAT family N-acetyltransferase n=1 Tax=Acinetobacter sp. KS-LM10 TaxID=3120518 RepID=UPI001F9E31D6|nr:GNAT family N-acetyltransferase [Candidatus Acinetobacter avistercoris]
MNYTIKILTLNDVINFRTIRLLALKIAPKMFGSNYEIEIGKPLSFFQDCINNSIVFGVYNEEQMIALATLTKEGVAKMSHKAYLSSVFVIPEFQNLGVANELLRTVINYAKQHIEQILLTVASDNFKAVKLYKKFNFEVYGIEFKALKDGDEYIDEQLMKLFLN